MKETWIAVARTTDCPPGRCIERTVAGRVLAICNVDGAFYALDGVCPHQGGPLGQGELRGHTLTCPWHGWQFDVRNGQHTIAATIRQPTFPLHVRGEQILIDRNDLTDDG